MARWTIKTYSSSFPDCWVEEEFEEDQDWEFVQRVIQLTANKEKFKLYDRVTESTFISE